MIEFWGLFNAPKIPENNHVVIGCSAKSPQNSSLSAVQYMMDSTYQKNNAFQNKFGIDTNMKKLIR